MNDEDCIFKALGDSTRRFLLDLLFKQDGQTLGELEGRLEMSRFGVMKHLKVLENAGLVITRRQGREKFHYLNAVPIRLIHDRWIEKYREREVSALADLKAFTGEQEMGSTEKSVINIHEIYIKAPAAAIWEAITSPEWSERYGYRGIYEYDMRPGGQFRVKANEGMRKFGLPETIIDGEVIECSPPTKLVQTYRFLFDDQQRKEGFSRITFEIEDTGQGFCRLTVTHDVTGQPTMGAATTNRFNTRGGGGWNWILSDLKSLLETGKTLA